MYGNSAKLFIALVMDKFQGSLSVKPVVKKFQAHLHVTGSWQPFFNKLIETGGDGIGLDGAVEIDSTILSNILKRGEELLKHREASGVIVLVVINRAAKRIDSSQCLPSANRYSL